jgi:hypothetical protein
MDAAFFIKGVQVMALSAMNLDHLEEIFVAAVPYTGEGGSCVGDDCGGFAFRARHDSRPLRSFRDSFLAWRF